MGSKSSKCVDILRCVLSAALLILAFPKTDWSALAWVGLVPLMMTLDGKRALDAFRWAYFCGFLFFGGTLYWFFHLTQWFSFIAGAGALLLYCYLSLYFGLFGFIYSVFSKRTPLQKAVFLPSAWVVLEFIRAHLFSGFDWASLGHTQYQNLPVIQIADITGVFGVSFMIVMANVCAKGAIQLKSKEKILPAILVAGITVALALGYGYVHLEKERIHRAPVDSVSVAVIQPNITQEDKWDETAHPRIFEKLMRLSEEAAQKNPDLMIWPETSYPGYLWEERDDFAAMQEFARRTRVPVLFGSVVKEESEYFNTALLLSGEGEVTETYRKIHLVPFGEFLPLRTVFPFLADWVDIGDFTPGDQWTVFRHKDAAAEKKFSVLICFEDTVAGLSRAFVREGAQLLVNMTNDAWFGDTKAPYMHLQNSVFRAVENRRDLVRVANTGVSCSVNRWGRILACVAKDRGPRSRKTYFDGYMITEAEFNDEMTFYTKFGDVFTIICFGCILWGILKKRRINIAEKINHLERNQA